MSIIRVYNAKGEFMERVVGEEAELRMMGVAVTKQRGQRGWRCALFRDGKLVATCRKGVWMDVAP